MPKNDGTMAKTIRFLLPSVIVVVLCLMGMFGFLPSVITSAVFATGIPSASLASVVMVISAWGIYGEATGVYVLLLWVVALILVAMLYTKKPYRTTLVANSMVISFAILLHLIMQSNQAGVAPFSEIIDSVVASYLTMGYMPPYQQIYDLGLTFLVALGVFYAWINLLFTRMVAIRTENAHRIKPMIRYELWQLSSQYNIVAILVTACIIVLGLWRGYDAMLYAYAGIFAICLPLCVQGFSFLGFMGRTGCLLFRTKYLLILGIIALFPTSLIVLAILGIVEQIFRFRKKTLNR